MSSVNNPGFQVDTSSIRTQQAHNPMAHDSKFSSILGGMALASNLAGPVAVESLNVAGSLKGSAVTSAAMMGLSGGGVAGGGSPHMSWGTPSPVSKNIGMPGTAPGYPGAGVSGAGGFGGAGGFQGVGDFDSQLNGFANNNMLLLGYQMKMQSLSQMVQLTSNIANTDHQSKMNSVRNMRAG